MSLSEQLRHEIENGIAGRNGIIPFAYKRLNEYIDIARHTMYTIGGETGAGKCLAKGTKVLMYNGLLKAIENIQTGELVMGADSQPRTVLSTTKGIDQLYWIRQNRGIDYKVNSKHILALRSKRKESLGRKTIPGQLDIHKDKRKRIELWGEVKTVYTEIPVEEAIGKNKTFYHTWKGYKVPVEYSETEVKLDPYYIGMWLGDGTTAKAQITTADPEVINYLEMLAEYHECEIVHPERYIYNIKGKKRLRQITSKGDIIYTSIREAAEKTGYSVNHLSEFITKKKKIGKGKGLEDCNWEWQSRTNNIWEIMKEYNLPNNKHIPYVYLVNSKENRLQLLAGLIDSDGSLDGNAKGYSITLKSKTLAQDVTILSRSLGYYTSMNSKIAKMKRKDGSVYQCEVWRILISSENIWEIPCKIGRKKVKNKSTKVSDSLNTGITIEKAEIGEYYGFQLSGDGLFLLEDLTVTHNSTIVQDAFLIRPIQWYLANKHKENIKLSIIYFGMERKMYMYSCRWLSRLIFEEQGIYISAKKILGRKKKGEEIDKMTDQEAKMVDDYLVRLDEWEADDLLIAHEGSKNPSGMSRYIEDFAKKHGTVHNKDKEDILGTKTYTPNHPNHIVLIITDHISILSPEREGGEGPRKVRIDKFSSTMREARDLYGFSPVIVQQLNRNMSDVQRQKLGDLKPKLSDFADSSSTSHDSDVILALHDPYRHGEVVNDMGYDIRRFKNERGDTFYRTVHILKNSFDSSNIAIQMAIHPFTGMLKSLVRSDKITDGIYEQVVGGQYFLND